MGKTRTQQNVTEKKFFLSTATAFPSVQSTLTLLVLRAEQLKKAKVFTIMFMAHTCTKRNEEEVKSMKVNMCRLYE